MNVWQLTKINIKRMFKDPLKIVFTIFLPIGVLILVGFLGAGPISSETIAVFNTEDRGVLWSEIVSVTESEQVFENDLQGALALLETNEVAVVYDIPADFSETITRYEKPVITAYKREEGNAFILLEGAINDRINKMIKGRLLLDLGIIETEADLHVMQTRSAITKNEQEMSGDMHQFTLLLVFFIILGSVPMVGELMEFKKKNVLARAITTPNSGATILAGFILAPLIMQVAVNVAVLFGFSLLRGFPVFSWPAVVSSFALASLFSITLSLAIVRVFNNESISSIVTVSLSLCTLFLAMFAHQESFAEVPKFVANLGKFTPQYWIFDSLDRSVLFPNALIVSLMVMALFSAGSYRLRNFISK